MANVTTSKRISKLIMVMTAMCALFFTAACDKTTVSENSPESTTTTNEKNNADTAADDVKNKTITPGKLTVATGNPAYSPWVIDDKPESGKGYEASIIYEVAKKLGFNNDDLIWKRSTFDSAIAPGPKEWDLNIQQFSITDQRRKAVDFSSSYFNSPQAIVVKRNSKVAGAKSLSDLKNATIGAAVGTISYSIAKDKINNDIKAFNDNDALVQGLDSGQLDGLVVDAPTAVFIVESKQVKDGLVLCKIDGSDDPNGLGIVLPKGSPLTAAVTKAVDELKADGTLKKLQDEWLKSYTIDLPALK